MNVAAKNHDKNPFTPYYARRFIVTDEVLLFFQWSKYITQHGNIFVSMCPKSGHDSGFWCRIWKYLNAFLVTGAKLLLLEQWARAKAKVTVIVLGV